MGIITLLVLIALLGVLPHLITPAQQQPDPEILATFQKDIDRLHALQQQTSNSVEIDSFKTEAVKNGQSAPRLFMFDPNTLNREGWQQLGLTPNLSNTILNFRNKGGRFYKPEDIRKIYGLSQPLYERLLPYVKIPSAAREAIAQTAAPEQPFRPGAGQQKKIDINYADTAQWVRLPAIGSKLATRIVLFRDKLGGFYSLQQVAEVYGISDSAFKVIQPYLLIGPYKVRKININTASYEQIKSHPYIKSQIATAIIQYRNQHQSFTSLESLRQVHLVTNDLYVKLVPYLEI